MKNHPVRILKAAFVLVCFGASLFSQTTNITLTDVQGPNLGGVYTDPYYGTVGTQTNVPIICDDFESETYFNESWTANITNLSTINQQNGGLKWGGGYSLSGNTWVENLNQTTAYTVAAVLATEILGAGNNIPMQEDLSFALWGLFDAGSQNGPFQYINGTDLTNAETYLQNAESYVQTNHLGVQNFSNVLIYSYNGGQTHCPGGYCPPPPQEFIRVMAEPSYPQVLAIELFGVIGLIVVLRRRWTNSYN